MKNFITSRSGARGALGAAVLALVAAGAMPVEGGASDVETAREALGRMVETRQLISKERRDWVLGKEILTDRLDLVRREVDSLRERIAQAEESVAEADKKRLELVAENDRLKAASSTLEELVEGLEGRTRELVARLPGPLVERVERLSQRLPAAEQETKLSLSERFLNVVGILNESNKFHREITPASEVRSLGDGRTAEVTALYVGLGQAYYVTANGDSAGVGRFAGDAWVWEPVDEAAPAVAEAISVLNGEVAPAFVQLPIRVE